MTLELESKPTDNSANLCHLCDFENAQRAKFCSDCGEPLQYYQTVESEAVSPRSSKLLYSNHIYAGFLKRAAALLLDIGILLLASYLFFLFSTSISLEQYFNHLLSSIYFYGVCWLYFLIMNASPFEGTFGKRLLKIHVCNLQGQPLSILHSVFRQVCIVITLLTGGIGYLFVLFAEHNQSLHDYLADSLVINSSTPSSQVKLINQQRRALSQRTLLILGLVTITILVLLVFQQQIFNRSLFSNAHYELSKLSQQNHQLQSAMLRFRQKAGKWPANIEQLNQYVGVVKQPGSEFVITDRGNYQQIFTRDSEIAGKIINWQIYQDADQHWHWRCSSTELELNQFALTCTGS